MFAFSVNGSSRVLRASFGVEVEDVGSRQGSSPLIRNKTLSRPWYYPCVGKGLVKAHHE